MGVFQTKPYTFSVLAYHMLSWGKRERSLLTILSSTYLKIKFKHDYLTNENRKLFDEKRRRMEIFWKTRTSFERGIGYWYFTLARGKLSPVSCSQRMRGSRLHIIFTQHRFQDWSVQVFLSGLNEFVYWAKVGHTTCTCWKHCCSKEPVF